MVELLCVAGREQSRAYRLPTHEARDPAQRLDVRARLGLRTGKQEEQPDRFTIHGFIWHRRPRGAGDRYEVGEGWGFPVWNRNAVANTRRELPLPLHHRLQDIGGGSVPSPSHEEVDQLPKHTLLALGPNGDPDAIGSQEFGESQWSMSKCRNRLKIVDLS